MFRITEDHRQGALYSAWLKNYKNDSIVSVDMDKVGVMAAYSDPLCACVHIRTCWSIFKYFIILIVSINYTLCISWIIKCLIVIDARCKHEDQSHRFNIVLHYTIQQNKT